MSIDEYTYTLTDGWIRAPQPGQIPAYIADDEDLGEWLFDLGYKQLAHSGVGRCYVGHFTVWGRQEPDVYWPRYALTIDQLDVDSVVWIDTLPDLWDFIAKYGQIGFAMSQMLPGEAADGPPCPDCGEPLRPAVDNDELDA